MVSHPPGSRRGLGRMRQSEVGSSGSCDGVVHDVLHSYYFTTTARKELLTEIYRISKPNALVSVYPKHMNLDTVKNDLETANFHFVKKLYVTLLHYYRLTQDYFLNFRRK